MWQQIHDGPTHITVDGTLANPYVLTAVIVVMFILTLSAYAASNSRHRGLWLTVVALGAIASSFEGTFIYHGLSYRLAWVLGGVRASTTYFGAPPSWPPIVAFIVGIALSVSARMFQGVIRKKHPEKSPKEH